MQLDNAKADELIGLLTAALARRHQEVEIDIVPTRLDMKTRVCLMASIIYGTAEPSDMTVEKACSAAVEIENLANQKVIEMKKQNPIPPRGVQIAKRQQYSRS